MEYAHNIKANDLKRIERMIAENTDIIINRWYELFKTADEEISKIWFDADWIYGLGDDGKTYRQSLLWYNKLRKSM